MSSLTPNHQFLLDENVKKPLLTFLKSQNFDVKISPKSLSDLKLALSSLEEKRIFVTNDGDFQWYSAKEIFSVILLRVAQSDTKSLLRSFGKLLTELKIYQGKLIILESDNWHEYPLIQKYGNFLIG